MNRLRGHSKEKGFTPEDDQGEGMSEIAEDVTDRIARAIHDSASEGAFHELSDNSIEKHIAWQQARAAMDEVASIGLAERTQHDEATRYAENLAVTLHRKHYSDNTQWRPLSGDLTGILTQIDNMTVGLVRKAEA